MPRVTIRTGFFTPDGREEELSDYLCDAPDCPNIATDRIAVVRELGLSLVMCSEHAASVRQPRTRSGSNDDSCL